MTRAYLSMKTLEYPPTGGQRSSALGPSTVSKSRMAVSLLGWWWCLKCPSQQIHIWSHRDVQFTLLATPGFEGTRYRLRFRNRFILPFPFFKFHTNMNKTESFSLWLTENTCSQTCDLHWNPNIWILFHLTKIPLPPHTQNHKKIGF